MGISSCRPPPSPSPGSGGPSRASVPGANRQVYAKVPEESRISSPLPGSHGTPEPAANPQDQGKTAAPILPSSQW